MNHLDDRSENDPAESLERELSGFGLNDKARKSLAASLRSAKRRPATNPSSTPVVGSNADDRPARTLGNWETMDWVLVHLYENDAYEKAPDQRTAKLAQWVSMSDDNLREFMHQMLPKLAQAASPQAQEILDADARDLSNLCEQVQRWAEQAEREAAGLTEPGPGENGQ
jgi:hypothetical protein